MARMSWTPFDDGLLMVLWLDLEPISVIRAAFPGRSPTSIYQRKARLELPDRMGGPPAEDVAWTPEEDAILRELRRRGVSAVKSVKSLPGRTEDSIYGRVKALGLPRRRSPHGQPGLVKHFELTTRVSEEVYMAFRRRVAHHGTTEADYLRTLVTRDAMGAMPQLRRRAA